MARRKRRKAVGAAQEEHTDWARVNERDVRSYSVRAERAARRGSCREAFMYLSNAFLAQGRAGAHSKYAMPERGKELRKGVKSMTAFNRATDAFTKKCMR